MSFLDKVKNMVNVSEDDYYDELESDDFRSDAGEEEPEEPRRPARRARERERDAGSISTPRRVCKLCLPSPKASRKRVP